MSGEEKIIELLTEIRDCLSTMTSSSQKVQMEAKKRADDAQTLMDGVMNMLPKEVVDNFKK